MFRLSDSKKLEKLLIDAELRTDGEIAEFTGVSRDIVSRMRNGHEVSLEMLVKVGGALLEKRESLEAHGAAA